MRSVLLDNLFVMRNIIRKALLSVVGIVVLSLAVEAQSLSKAEQSAAVANIDEYIRLLSNFGYDTPELMSDYESQLSEAEEIVKQYSNHKTDIVVYERWYILSNLAKQSREMMNFYKPKMADGLYRKGVAMQEAGDGKSATNYFNKAIDVNPNHVLSHLQLAVMDIDSTKLGEASERLYNIMSGMNPNADEKALIKGLLEYAYNKNYMYAISLEQQEKYPQAVAVMLELEAFCEKDKLNICDSMNVQNVLERCRTGVYAAQIDMARKALKSERNDVAEEFALAAYNYYSENKEDIHDDMKFAQLAKQISESYIAEALEMRGDPLADEYMAHAQALAEYTDKDTRELLEAKISTLNPGKTPLELEYEAIEKENVEESYAERFDNYLADNEKVEPADVQAEIEKIENDYVNDNTKQGITSATELTEEMEAALAETKEYLAIGSYDKALEALDQATKGGVAGASEVDIDNMYLMAIREITAKRMSAAEFAIWQGEQEVADSLIAVTNELITTYDVALDTGIARIMQSYLLTLDKKLCSKRQDELDAYVYGITDCLKRKEFVAAEKLVRTALAVPESRNCKLDKTRLKALMQQVAMPLEYLNLMDKAQTSFKYGDTSAYIRQYASAEALYNRYELGTMGVSHVPIRNMLQQTRNEDYMFKALELIIAQKEYMVALEAIGAMKDAGIKASKTKKLQDDLAKNMSYDMAKQLYTYEAALDTIIYYSADKWYKHFTKSFKKYMKKWLKEMGLD
jgi:hypothetical protein